MFELIFILIIIYIIINKSKGYTSNIINTSSLLNKALVNQQFSNIKTIYSSNSLILITADSHGENYLFALKNNGSQFSLTELDSIYDKSKKLHTHNVVIITNNITTPVSSVNQKITDYNFEVWSMTKLASLARPSVNNNDSNTTYTKSVLRSSNTSYDKCKIDDTPVDPIQHGASKSHSLFGNLFHKPDRL